MSEENKKAVEQESLPATMPTWAYQKTVEALKTVNKRLWIALLVLFIAFVATNAAWMVYENQFEDIVVTQDIATGEGAAVVSGTGDATYAEGKTNSEIAP